MLNHRLALRKVHRVIKINQKAWLKPYINVNTKLRKAAKTDFEKEFLKLMNSSGFGKSMEKNIWKHRDIKHVTTERRKNYLVLELNHHSIKFFIEYVFAIDMRKTKILMKNLVYLGLSILDMIKL